MADMMTVIAHVRHRVGGHAIRVAPPLRTTLCGLRFMPGPSSPVHEPAERRCYLCYGKETWA